MGNISFTTYDLGGHSQGNTTIPDLNYLVVKVSIVVLCILIMDCITS